MTLPCHPLHTHTQTAENNAVHLFYCTIWFDDCWYREIFWVKGLFQYKQQLICKLLMNFPRNKGLRNHICIFWRKWATFVPSHLSLSTLLSQGPPLVTWPALSTQLIHCFLFALFSKLVVSETDRQAAQRIGAQLSIPVDNCQRRLISGAPPVNELPIINMLINHFYTLTSTKKPWMPVTMVTDHVPKGKATTDIQTLSQWSAVPWDWQF